MGIIPIPFEYRKFQHEKFMRVVSSMFLNFSLTFCTENKMNFDDFLRICIAGRLEVSIYRVNRREGE